MLEPESEPESEYVSLKQSISNGATILTTPQQASLQWQPSPHNIPAPLTKEILLPKAQKQIPVFDPEQTDVEEWLQKVNTIANIYT